MFVFTWTPGNQAVWILIADLQLNSQERRLHTLIKIMIAYLTFACGHGRTYAIILSVINPVWKYNKFDSMWPFHNDWSPVPLFSSPKWCDFSHQCESELFESFSIESHKNMPKCAFFAFLQLEHQFGLKNKI